MLQSLRPACPNRTQSYQKYHSGGVFGPAFAYRHTQALRRGKPLAFVTAHVRLGGLVAWINAWCNKNKDGRRQPTFYARLTDPPGQGDPSGRFAAAAATVSGRRAGDTEAWSPWDEVAKREGVKSEEQTALARGPDGGSTEPPEKAADAGPPALGGLGGAKSEDEAAAQEDNASRHEAAPEGDDEVAQGGGTNEDGGADWDEDTGTWNGGPTGDAAFNGDEYPPEEVTAVNLPCARLPMEEHRSGRHGLRAAIVLDIPDSRADIWISTGSPHLLCHPDAAMCTVVSERDFDGWEIDRLVLLAASNGGGEADFRATRAARAQFPVPEDQARAFCSGPCGFPVTC